MKCIALLAAALLLAGCGERRVQSSHQGLRIVAMAPNTTEILYALGLSNSVVGVSHYAVYPPEAKQKPSVGGTYDPNFEMIVALQPDLVIGLETQKDIAAQLKALDIPFFGVAHEHISEIMQSILTIGKACGAEAEAQQLFQSLEATALRLTVSSGDRKPRVLVCVGHDESLSRMYVAGKGTFYDELIERAGGINACGESAAKYPEISPEGLATLRPDVVIDILPNPGHFTASDWKPYRAVVITNDYASIPGPRFVLLLQDFIKAIHE
ncbi:MAG: ABC transporter substrate-binding protein [Kiritimatiellaceae bacterium]|nr:ABC transporter substrate-binding protein [Kiritimatiellaceae bacterium]